jgi:tetratricopeptide (TPR) repeat protein
MGYLNLGRVYQTEGRLPEATEVLNKALKADPPAPWWTVAWFTGLVNAQNDHLEEAAASYRQILDPKLQDRQRKFDFTRDYVVINELGKTLFELSQGERDNPAARDRYLREAAEQFERTLSIDSEDLDAHYGLAQCYTRLGGSVPALAGAAPDGEVQELVELGQTFANVKEPVARRLEAAGRLVQAVPAFGQLPSIPNQPKLPVLQSLMAQCLPVYRQKENAELTAAAAMVLGPLHREAHAIFKPDELAQARAVALYNRDHPAGAHASQAIVVYPLHRQGAPGRD